MWADIKLKRLRRVFRQADYFHGIMPGRHQHGGPLGLGAATPAGSVVQAGMTASLTEMDTDFASAEAFTTADRNVMRLSKIRCHL